MPSTGSNRDSTRLVSVFQKAHNHVAVLQKIDDQIAALFEQRRRAIEDLRAVQALINGEFDRVLELDRVVPADTLSLSGDDEVSKDSRGAAREPVLREAKATSAGTRIPTFEPAATLT